MVFLATAGREGGNTALELASEGGEWLRGKLATLPADYEPGLFTGVAGCAVVFNELARAGVDTSADMALVFERLVSSAVTTSVGVHWRETTEVLWGTAGIGFTLLALGAPVIGDEALELAARAGDWLLSVAYEVPEGLRWDVGEGAIRQMPGTRYAWMPNFAHGTAGIAAYLARLGAAVGEERFLEGAARGGRWVLSNCRTEDDTCAARNSDPASWTGPRRQGPARDPDDTSPMYTLGWCHGPPGLGWMFRELQLATSELATSATGSAAEWAEWIPRTARAVRQSGIPERKEPGFWDNVGRCCGSAGVAEYFLDLHTWRDDPDDLAFAVAMVDDLLERAIVDEKGMRWSNVEWRSDPPELSPETTFYQGASGIGLTLLRLARHLEGDDSTVHWPHYPDWRGAGPPAAAG
jgi:lantibiotic modifying enzyme